MKTWTVCYVHSNAEKAIALSCIPQYIKQTFKHKDMT